MGFSGSFSETTSQPLSASRQSQRQQHLSSVLAGDGTRNRCYNILHQFLLWSVITHTTYISVFFPNSVPTFCPEYHYFIAVQRDANRIAMWAGTTCGKGKKLSGSKEKRIRETRAPFILIIWVHFEVYSSKKPNKSDYKIETRWYAITV